VFEFREIVEATHRRDDKHSDGVEHDHRVEREHLELFARVG
jgi:hypothetical protein